MLQFIFLPITLRTLPHMLLIGPSPSWSIDFSHSIRAKAFQFGTLTSDFIFFLSILYSQCFLDVFIRLGGSSIACIDMWDEWLAHLVSLCERCGLSLVLEFPMQPIHALCFLIFLVCLSHGQYGKASIIIFTHVIALSLIVPYIPSFPHMRLISLCF